MSSSETEDSDFFSAKEYAGNLDSSDSDMSNVEEASDVISKKRKHVARKLDKKNQSQAKRLQFLRENCSKEKKPRPKLIKHKRHWDDRTKKWSKQDQTNLQRNQNRSLESIRDDLINLHNKTGGGYILNVFQPNFKSITFYTFPIGFGEEFCTKTEYGKKLDDKWESHCKNWQRDRLSKIFLIYTDLLKCII